MGSQIPFTADVEARDGVAKIALSGELDLATVPLLGEHLERFESDGVTAIVLDLRNLTFMDSTGLVACLRARDRAVERGHRFMIVQPGPAPQRIFEITGTEFLLDDGTLDGWGDGLATRDGASAVGDRGPDG